MAIAVDPTRIFADAEAFFRRGDAENCVIQLRRLPPDLQGHSAVLHLFGLALKRLGKLGEARTKLQRARQTAPYDPHIANNLGNISGELGENDQALDAYDAALKIKPDFAEALRNKAIILHRLGKYSESRLTFDLLHRQFPQDRVGWNARAAMEKDAGHLILAEQAYAKALALSEHDSKALLGLARTKLEMRKPDAENLFSRLLQIDPYSEEAVIGLAEALEQSNAGDPDDVLERALTQNPEWINGHRLLTRIRAEREGTTSDFARSFDRAAQLRHLVDPIFWLDWGNALAHAGRHAEALDVLGRMPTSVADRPSIALARALWSSEADMTREADAYFARLDHDAEGVVENHARHFLRCGRIDEAAAMLEKQNITHQLNVAEWAYLGIAWRILQDPRHRSLFGSPPYVRQFKLELSLQQLEDVSNSVRRLHREDRTHPLSQSLRGGTQTRGRLFDIPCPHVQLLKRAAESALHEFIDTLPEVDRDHPLLRSRDTAPRITGSWSVLLRPQGFHVHHIHSAGWLSSACYLSLPPDASAYESHAGSLAVGTAPTELNLDLAPLAVIRPVVGTIALFPSYMFHGTMPFSEGERLTAAFDVIPDPSSSS